MSKNEQVLTIEPQNELRFRGPFNVPVTSYMQLTNPTDKKVLFKIKTTAPKKYCVRPNSGVLDPKGTLGIAICLQPFIFEPSEKNKHKFMVQTVIAPEDSTLNFEQQWKEISQDQLMDTKLKCVFELPPEQNEAHEANETSKISSPKVPIQSPPVTTTTNESELQKAAAEVLQLREEESSLRQENLRLKEEILRLKHAAPGIQTQVANKYTPVQQPNNMSMIYMAVGVALALFGIILGKFIL